MAKLVNRVKMTTATTGTGTITLGSAVSGYQSFSDAGVTDADVVRYVIEDGSNWEIGEGTYTASGTTLSRTVLESSNAGAAISLGGDATVFVTAVVEDIQQPPSEGAFVDGDKTKLDGIEANADVTDTTNVTAAGALMDSEVTNLAAVKAFDPADYAVADGDVLDVNYTPTNYTPDATPAEAADVDDLAAHLKGIDTAIGSAGGGGLVFLASTDISSAATVDFTAFDATKYDAYKFVIQNLAGSGSVADVNVRTSTDGGSTFDSGSTDYRWVLKEAETGSSTITAISSITTEAQITLLQSELRETNDSLSGEVTIFSPHIAKRTLINWNLSFDNESASLFLISGSGMRDAEEEVNAIRFLLTSGNISSGTITMYGMVNA